VVCGDLRRRAADPRRGAFLGRETMACSLGFAGMISSLAVQRALYPVSASRELLPIYLSFGSCPDRFGQADFAFLIHRGLCTELLSGSLVDCMKWQEDPDGRTVPIRFVIALDADSSPVPLDKLLCDE